jgi:hypothetical protein
MYLRDSAGKRDALEPLVSGQGRAAQLEAHVPQPHITLPTGSSRVVAEASKRTSIAFTRYVCSHIIYSMQQDTTMLLDGVLPIATNGVSCGEMTPD